MFVQKESEKLLSVFFLAIFIDQLIRSIYQMNVRNCKFNRGKVEGLGKAIIISIHILKRKKNAYLSIVNNICR